MSWLRLTPSRRQALIFVRGKNVASSDTIATIPQ